MRPEFDHLAIASRDPQKLAAWCEQMFAAEIVEGNQSGSAALVKISDAGNCQYVEIMPSAKTAEISVPPPIVNCGFHHFALRVKNLDEAIANLDQHRAQWTNEISPAIGGGRVRNFRDPEGNIWQLVER